MARPSSVRIIAGRVAMEMTAAPRRRCSAAVLLFALCCLESGVASAAPDPLRSGAIDFAARPPVIDLGPSLTPERITEAGDPHGSWFTITVQNSQAMAVARVLTAFSAPGAALAFEPLPAH